MSTPLATKAFSLEELRILCAWCGTEIRAPRRRTASPPPESHGICVACAVRLGMPAELCCNNAA